jgi:hypothetical protein
MDAVPERGQGWRATMKAAKVAKKNVGERVPKNWALSVLLAVLSVSVPAGLALLGKGRAPR